MPRIALVTARAAEPLDEDLAPLAAALRRAAAEPFVACWDDPEVDWGAFDAAVLRSAWDYPQHFDEFMEWVAATDASVLLLNGADTIRWNADKHYLADLAARGIPTVPTTFLEPGDVIDLPADRELVVKPAVSAGAKDTARFAPGDVGAVDLAASLLGRGRAVMVQPYQEAVDTIGEHALVCFDGRFSHAFRKGPILETGAAPTAGLHADEEIGPARISESEIALAERIVRIASDLLGDLPLYARVDLVPGDDGAPLLLELELIEPSVYHGVAPASADEFASAILHRLGREDRAIRLHPGSA